MVSTSSFTPLELAEREANLHKSSGRPTASVQAQKTVDALLFPAFKHFKNLTTTPAAGGGRDDDDEPGHSHNNARTLIRSSLLPEKDRLNKVYNTLSESERTSKSRDPSLAASLDATPIQVPTILICSHGQRDHRCGVLGPLLHDEFARYISSRTTSSYDEEAGSMRIRAAATGAFVASAPASPSSDSPGRRPGSEIPVNIGMISHIGGHKWAGNVIMYIPPGMQMQMQMQSPLHVADGPRPHPLAGKGIWYGRVEPRHVEGIIEQTLVRGNVIRELFRGGLSAQGEVLRL